MVSIKTFTHSNGAARTAEGAEGDEASALMERAIGIATSVLSLAAANNKIRAFASVLEQLGAQGGELKMMLDDAEKRFGGVNVAIDEQIGAFQGVLGSVAGEIERINENTSRTLDEANGIAATMAGHHETIAGHVDRLVQTQGGGDQRLGARQAAMETLLTTVAAKHENFESVIGTFSALIEDSVRKADSRARDIGTLLSEQAQYSIGQIDERPAAVRDNAGKERERAATALRAACGTAAHELEDVSGRSAQRFQAAAEELRGLSRSIQEELATTREEARRSVVELARETPAQAAGIRRVVGEQIRMLGELTDIAARSGRSPDFSVPSSRTPQSRDGEALISDPVAPAWLEAVRRERQEARHGVAQEALRQEAARQVTARREQAGKPQAREEQAREEQARQEQALQEQARQEQARQEQARQEQARQEQARQEQARQEQARQEQARQEQARQEQARQEQARQEQARQEQARQEQARQEQARQEQARQEQARQEQARQEQARQEQARQEQAREEQALQEQVQMEAARRQSPPTPSRRQAPRGQGWMSDLLSRASKNEEPQQPSLIQTKRSNPEPIEAISTDLARMVDPKAAADAWERYRRGEDDAFDASIYKGRGSQKFEEIRHRYKADDRFRLTVDRYVQEFERILWQIQHDDPEDRVLRDYLGSDSGKLYTMLAHAAGRIA